MIAVSSRLACLLILFEPHVRAWRAYAKDAANFYSDDRAADRQLDMDELQMDKTQKSLVG